MLSEILPHAFDVALDLRYAGPDNLTGRPIHRHARAFLVPAAAERLKLAARLARGFGCGLRVYDAYRPVEAQWRLWRALPDPLYIADPRIGSNHSRGVAIDVGLDDADGRPLTMGTVFDEMDPRSHHARLDLPAEVQRHRALLAGVMAAAGWDLYAAEWWHYQLPQATHYPLLCDGAGGPALMADP